jgi:hypothetical protein
MGIHSQPRRRTSTELPMSERGNQLLETADAQISELIGLISQGVKQPWPALSRSGQARRWHGRRARLARSRQLPSGYWPAPSLASRTTWRARPAQGRPRSSAEIRKARPANRELAAGPPQTWPWASADSRQRSVLAHPSLGAVRPSRRRPTILTMEVATRLWPWPAAGLRALAVPYPSSSARGREGRASTNT